MFIIQIYKDHKWQDIHSRRTYENAVGDAWEASLHTDGPYRKLTRVIVRVEKVLKRFGQKEES